MTDSALVRVFRKARSFGVLLREEGRSAGDALFQIRSQPLHRQKLLIRNSRKFQSFALADLLLQESIRYRFDAPDRASQFAALSLLMTSKLSVEKYPGSLLHDLAGRGFGHLGNASRILSDFNGAARLFAKAQSLLERGSCDPELAAELLTFKASLESGLGHFLTALRMLDQAMKLYKINGDGHLMGRTLIQRGLIAGYGGDGEACIGGLVRGLAMIDSRREPRLEMIARHNIMLHLHAMGRDREALELFETLPKTGEDFSGPLPTARLYWLEGLIHHGLEERRQAERCFQEARRIFAEQEIGFDYAVVSLDLAMVYLEQGRFPEIQHLAIEILQIFESRKVHREAAAAFLLFQQAAEAETVSRGWIRGLSRFLWKARSDPGLRFSPSE